jgi:hypothetical protein
VKEKSLRTVVDLTVILAILVSGLALACAQRPRRASGSPPTITVRAGENLQAAIDKARYGDTIVVEAGATFVGPLRLTDKGENSGNDADYITIRTSDLAGISPEGERVNPRQARSLPKIVSPNEQAAVNTAPRAHHYKFIGIEFAPAANAKYVYNLIDLGQGDYTSLSQFPHHLIFDRCYVHSTGLNRARRGFALNSAETSVLNSYVSGFAGAGDETQAIAGWNGPGPFHIVNNFLEAGAEVVLIGGADPSISGLVPADIEIRRNYLHRPAEWQGQALIKGTFELKNARRVVIDGNLLESEILTTAFVITVRNQGGRAPWSVIEDVTLTNNIVRHAATGINILGSDNEQKSQEARRIRIANNLLTDLTPDDPNNTAYFLQINGADSVLVEHNTVEHKGHMIKSYGAPSTDFIFRDNILQYNHYGIACLIDGSACHDNLFCRCFPAGQIRGNVIADNEGAIDRDALKTKYPAGNLFTHSFDTVGFVASGRGNWRLAATSRYRGKATDGNDPGVNVDAVLAAGAEKAKSGLR